MRVLLVNPAYDEGPGPGALLDLYDTLTGWGEALRATGEVEVVTLQRFSRNLELERGGIRYLFRADQGGPRPKPWTRPRRFLSAACESGADVVHANGLAFPMLLWQLRRMLGPSTPMLVQHHGGRPPRLDGFQAPWRRALWRLGLSGADAFLFTAEGQALPWRSAGLIRPEQTVHALPESSRSMPRVAREDARLRSGLRGRPQLLWVGHLVPSKDPLAVIDGFSRVLPALPEAELALVYRKDDLLPALRERLARDRTLSAHVRLLGPRTQENLPDLYGSSDFFVSGSHEEGSGYALLEALSCGLVPVVTDIPSFRALTAAGASGGLWPPGDSAAFSRALLDAARRPLDAQRDAVTRHFDAELSWPAVARRALSLYRQSVAARRP